MAGDDPRDPSDAPTDGVDRPQDPIVDRLRRDPAKRAQAAVRMTGFLGDSDRPGFRRLYFTRELDYFAEFRVEDVVEISSVAAEERPFRGDQATRVTLRREATVDYTRTHVAQEIDEFDLDVQLSRRPGAGRTPPVIARMFGCPTDTCDTNCDQQTCNTCDTNCDQQTCNTCHTNCGQHTCGTCDTQCDQQTCGFCPVETVGGRTCIGATECEPALCPIE
jgi:hypothetical protein